MPTESDVQSAFMREMRKRGHKALKVQQQGVQGQNGWPDTLVPIRRGLCIWIEFKHPEKKLKFDPVQARVAADLRELGHVVLLHNNAKAAVEDLDRMLENLG